MQQPLGAESESQHMNSPVPGASEQSVEITQPVRRADVLSFPTPAATSTTPTANQIASSLVLAQGLTKKFANETAVSDLNFAVPPGLIFGFIGPSGCGKTTTVRLMTGIYQPTSGAVTVLGQSPQNFTADTRKALGYMPQQFVMYPNLSVWENLNFSASLYGMGLRRSKRFRELLDFVELTEHRNKLARQLSGGMQRRLALAASMVHDPQVLFLDEPTAGIDPVLRRKFWDYFAVLKQRGRSLFITTQYVGEAAYCDLIAVMAAGRLLMVETPEGLRQRAFGGDVVELRTANPSDYRLVQQLRQLPFVTGPVSLVGEDSIRVTVNDAGTAIPELMEWVGAQNVDVQTVEKFEPPLDDVFVELVRREGNDASHA
jgi:ABC-2 type transport system ATP-binding protein